MMAGGPLIILDHEVSLKMHLGTESRKRPGSLLTL